MFGWVRRSIGALALALVCVGLPVVRAEQPVIRIFTEDGLVRNWMKRIRRDRVADGLPHRYVAEFLDAGNGRYWVVTGAGLHVFHPRGGLSPQPSFANVSLDPPGDPGDYPGQGEPQLFQTRSGDVWLASGIGLYRIEMRGGERAVLKSLRRELGLAREPDIRAITDDADCSLWLAAGPWVICVPRDGRL
jgi:hypothetical protein